jgi:hypothetical protein
VTVPCDPFKQYVKVCAYLCNQNGTPLDDYSASAGTFEVKFKTLTAPVLQANPGLYKTDANTPKDVAVQMNVERVEVSTQNVVAGGYWRVETSSTE